jgi:hypothetical protein
MVSEFELTNEEGDKLDSYIFKISKQLSDSKTVVFDGTDWLLWERMIYEDLIPLRLMKFLLQENHNLITDYDRQKFEMINMKLCHYLMVRLAPIPKRSINQCTSAFLIWQKLKKLYASTTNVMQNKLRDSWSNLTMSADQTLAEWVQSVDYMAQKLGAAEIPLDDKAKLHRLLRGLSSDWSQEKRYFELGSASYEEVCLKMYEIGEQREEPLARKPVPAFQTNPRQHRQPYRPAFQKGANGVTCFTCGKSNHSYTACPTGLKPTFNGGYMATRCFNCLKEGHVARHCLQPKKAVDSKALIADVQESQESDEPKPNIL